MSNQTQPTVHVQSPPQRSGLSGCVGAALIMSVCMMILLVTLAAPVFLGLKTFGDVIDSIRDFFSTERTASVASTQTIVNSVQPLGQLVSINTQLARADIRVSIRQGIGNACGYSASHVAQGTVEAGVDLTGLTEDNLSYNPLTGTYTLTLPPPQLTSCRVEYIRQYDRSTNFCGVDWDEARLLAQYEALVGFRNEAIEGGILERARQEAEVVLGNFIRLTTGRSVEIVFASTVDGQPVFGPSCTPELPPGWVYNETENDWEQP